MSVRQNPAFAEGAGGTSVSGTRVKTARCCIGALTFVLVAALPALCQPAAAGRIKIASGTAFILRDSAQIPAQAGVVVFQADGLRTGLDGHIGLTLKDATRISLGPSSEVRLDRFLYAPADSRFDFILRVVRGTAAYVSGQIARLAPDSIRLETPASILGIRGTHLVIRVEPN
jgi:hypothetical protein